MRVFPNGSGILIGLLITFALAWFLPWGGGEDDSSYSSITAASSVFLIFFSQGWNLQIHRLGAVFKEFGNLFRVHGFIFFGPPIAVSIAGEFNLIPVEWFLGFLFLSILPTTISSCVVYTSLAEGDSASALGHATLSNLMAMIWVPFAWILFVEGSEGEWLDRSVRVGQEVIPKIALLFICPSFLGWYVKSRYFQRRALWMNNWFKKVSFIGILVLVYIAFSETISGLGKTEFISLFMILFPYLIGFLIGHLILSWVGIFWASNKAEVKIAEFFCISQKSLAMGLPLLAVINGNDFKSGGLIACPLILYHFLQLSFGICFVPQFKKWVGHKSS